MVLKGASLFPLDLSITLYRLSIVSTGCRHIILFQYLDVLSIKQWHCSALITLAGVASLSSTGFILGMTFERFYSIIRPHKAASFNTVNRAKITIACIIFFSVLFDVPHVFMTLKVGKNCIPYGYGDSVVKQFYYWLSLVVNFFLPFVLLLIMNSVIMHTLRQRSMKNMTLTVKTGEDYNQGHCQGDAEDNGVGEENKKSQWKNTERQISM